MIMKLSAAQAARAAPSAAGTSAGSAMLSTTLARSAPIMQAKPNQCAAPSRPISGTAEVYQLRTSRLTASCSGCLALPGDGTRSVMRRVWHQLRPQLLRRHPLVRAVAKSAGTCSAGSRATACRYRDPARRCLPICRTAMPYSYGLASARDMS